MRKYTMSFPFVQNVKLLNLKKVADPKLTRERNLIKYACQDGHKLFDYPTVKRKHWRWRKCNVEEDKTNRRINDNQVGRPLRKKKWHIIVFGYDFQRKEKGVLEAQ